MKKFILGCLLIFTYSFSALAGLDNKCSVEIEFSNGKYLNENGVEMVGMSELSTKDAKAFIGKMIGEKGYVIADQDSAGNEIKLEMGLVTGIPDGKIYGSYSRFTTASFDISTSSEVGLIYLLSSSSRNLTIRTHKKTLKKLLKQIPDCREL